MPTLFISERNGLQRAGVLSLAYTGHLIDTQVPHTHDLPNPGKMLMKK